MSRMSIVIAALAALVCLQAASAYRIGQVCTIDFNVLYTDSFTRTLTLTHQNTRGEITMRPGTFTITVKGYLCSSPTTVAFNGTSGSITLTPGAAPISVNILALDQEAYNNVRVEGGTFSPVFLSLVISPTIVRVGAATTVSVTAIDPVYGVPSGYYFNTTGSGSYPLTQACGSAGACSLQYQAGVADSGFVDFDFTALDADPLDADTTISGIFRIDRTAAVQFDLETYFIPTILTPLTVAPSNSINLGAQNMTFTFDVEDPDITVHGDTITLNVDTRVVRNFTGSGAYSLIDCSTNDIFVTSTTTANTKTYTVTWAPATTHTNVGTYGETYCEFEFEAVDSKGLVSQKLRTTGRVIDHDERALGVTALQPFFNLIFIDSVQIAAGDSFHLDVEFSDLDSNAHLSITSEGLFAAVTENNIANCNPDCTRSYNPVATTTLGNYTITLRLTDAVDARLIDERTIKVIVVPASRRREAYKVISPARTRSAGNSKQLPTMNTLLAIQNGKLAVSVGSLGLGTESDSATPASKGSGAPTFVGLGAGIGLLVVAVAAAFGVRHMRKRQEASKEGGAERAGSRDLAGVTVTQSSV